MLFSPQLSDLSQESITCGFFCQGTTGKVSTPSSSLLPATSLTATWLITTTSWKTSSCECPTALGGTRGSGEQHNSFPCVPGVGNPSWEQAGAKPSTPSVQLQTGVGGTGGTPAPAPSPTNPTIQIFGLIMPGMDSQPGWDSPQLGGAAGQGMELGCPSELLVPEGHLGHQTSSDTCKERTWRCLRVTHKHLKKSTGCFLSLVLVPFAHQVRDQQPGAAGGRGLHDRVPEWGHAPQEDARPGLAQEMLPDD